MAANRVAAAIVPRSTIGTRYGNSASTAKRLQNQWATRPLWTSQCRHSKKKPMQKFSIDSTSIRTSIVDSVLADTVFIDLLMGGFRGAVSHHGGVPENCPLALMGRFPSLMGRFLSLMGRFPKCLNGPFSLLIIPWKTAY